MSENASYLLRERKICRVCTRRRLCTMETAGPICNHCMASKHTDEKQP